ncbi:hypothetical protein [Coleofasciculus sp. FACHB-T130]|uniref:hypothetical protein n=1 Tax=Cyanophyceae TaxID=3028117 RepID=UPI00168474CB|nr:hypothetical protein [Coleofasciculus sp. FACHB-T130]MBD1878350.1 hypothetical protein [Coleofasciculus sp. FACHB-T130]
MFTKDREALIQEMNEAIAEVQQGKLTTSEVVEAFTQMIEEAKQGKPVFAQAEDGKNLAELGVSDLSVVISLAKVFLTLASSKLSPMKYMEVQTLERVINAQEITASEQVTSAIFVEHLASGVSVPDAIVKLYRTQIARKYPATHPMVVEAFLVLIRVTLANLETETKSGGGLKAKTLTKEATAAFVRIAGNMEQTLEILLGDRKLPDL